MSKNVTEKAQEALLSVVTANVVEAETHLADVSGLVKKKVVIAKVLGVVYDIADALYLRFPELVDNKVKDEYIPALVDRVVETLNATGIFKHRDKGIM